MSRDYKQPTVKEYILTSQIGFRSQEKIESCNQFIGQTYSTIKSVNSAPRLWAGGGVYTLQSYEQVVLSEKPTRWRLLIKQISFFNNPELDLSIESFVTSDFRVLIGPFIGCAGGGSFCWWVLSFFYRHAIPPPPVVWLSRVWLCLSNKLW